MKRNTVKIVIWSVVAVLLTAMLVTLMFVPGILSGINIELPFVSAFTYPNSDKYSVGNGSTENVSKLEIEWISGSITIEKSTGDKVEFFEDGNSADDAKLHWYNENGTLHIKFAKNGWLSTINTGKNLTVKVPSDLQQIEIDSVSGWVSITDVNAEKYDIDSVSGDVTLSGVTGYEFETDNTSGKLALSEVNIKHVDADSVSGDIMIAYADGVLTGDAEIDTVSGRISFVLPEAAGFTAEVSSVSGDFNSDMAVTKHGSTYKSGNEGLQLDVSSISGDITVNKK